MRTIQTLRFQGAKEIFHSRIVIFQVDGDCQAKVLDELYSDTDGREKVPMFFSTDEKDVAKSHELYLAEIVLHYYRLHARTAHSKATYSRYDIHCPVCGHVMDAISSHINEHTREATRNNESVVP